MNDKGLAYLFIDDVVVESLDGAAKGVVPAQKVSDEPVMMLDQPWEVEWEIDSYVNVIHDEAEDIFKMWYEPRRRLTPARGEMKDGVAYAVSKDGVHWEKPVLNLVEDNGSKANNMVFPMLRWSTGHGVMKDPIEADPARRYKMLFMLQCDHMSLAGITQPVCVAYSPDGIHWNVPQYWLNPVIPKGTDTHITAHWDAKIHKYVVYLRGTPNVRIICQSESDDFENWTPRKIIVQPDEQDPPQDHEFYGMTSMAYRNWRIGFLSVFHTLYEGWIAQNRIEEWMPEWMNQMDIQLAYSKDGRTWHRAGNRQPILTCGPRGRFDSGSVYPPHAPFLMRGEIWLYYGGGNRLHGEPPRHGGETRRAIGLAKIRKDRLVCLKAEKKGLATTIPLGINPAAMWINADATGGSLQVELVDPFDHVLPGFGKDDCVPFTGDETEHQIQWKSVSQTHVGAALVGLEGKMVSQVTGGCKVKVYLDKAKLFAIYSDVG